MTQGTRNPTRPGSDSGDSSAARERGHLDQLTRANDDGSAGDARHAERFAVVVIGAGQAGLSVGYHLARLGISFVILDAHARVGDAWRTRWDSLRLFTPARYDALEGMQFPAGPHTFPTKNEMADYLESYATRFKLPVRTGVRVERLAREGERYVIIAGGRRLEAEHVVVAMSSYQRPRVPAFAGELDPRIQQMHSFAYRRPAQLPEGDALVVGAANSGAEIALDLARAGRRVWLSGTSPGELPFDIENPFALRVIVPFLFRVVFHRIITMDTPIGRKARPNFRSKGLIRIRTKTRDLEAAGVKLAPRTLGVDGGRPRLADGTVLDVSSVVWSTGFDIGPNWIEIPVFDDAGEPIQSRGVVPNEPGLYFVGPHFLYSASSTMIHGIARDARCVAETIGRRHRATVA